MSNKFNIAWQLTRVLARQIKNIDTKIRYVTAWLEDNPNIHNYDRVMNWLRTTSMGYKNSGGSPAFTEAIKNLERNKDKFKSTEDTILDLKDIPTEDLQMVFKDLSSRKYDFQFKSTPKEHTKFVEFLRDEIDSRNENP